MRIKKILKSKNETVTIIGIGYVGLPLACLCGSKGYKTFGIAKEKNKVKLINNGKSPMQDDLQLSKWVAQKSFTATTSYDSVKKSDILIVCVPTPVDDQNNPDLGPIRQVCKRIAKDLKKGHFLFDKNIYLEGYDSSDTDFSFQLEAKGLRGYYEKKLVVHHEELSTFTGFIKKAYYRGRLAFKITDKWKLKGEFVDQSEVNLLRWLAHVRHWPNQYKKYTSDIGVDTLRKIAVFLLIKIFDRVYLQGFVDQKRFTVRN
ncbi:hypothetical protein IID19_01470 [Patescibacteria group bacterium]|nr:hypothetical protein [Patescibacteria group bacterium]